MIVDGDVYFKDLVSRVLAQELRLINKHLPYKRVSLCDLKKMSIPYLVLRDGSTHLIDPKELEYIEGLLKEEACKLMIPVIIEARQSLGEGSYVVRDEMAKKLVSTILGLEYEWGKPLIIYRPHVYRLRELLPTTTTIIFSPA